MILNEKKYCLKRQINSNHKLKITRKEVIIIKQQDQDNINLFLYPQSVFINLMKIYIQQLQMRVFQIVIIFLLGLELCFCDQVDCIKVQNSMRGYYTFCSSTNSFPLKIQSTVVVLNDYIFTSSYSWKYWLRSINGQILKLDDYCMTNNPSNGLRPQFSNITFGLTCYQLPRKVQYGDSIQISFFDDYYFDKLIYLLPLTIKAQVQTLQSIEHKHQATEIIQQAVKIQIQPLKTALYKQSSQ